MQKLYIGNKDISTSLKLDDKYIDVAWPVYTSSIEIEYLVVGGGGGGGRGTSNVAGGGGAAGSVNTGSFVLQTVDTAPDPFTVNVQVGQGGSMSGNPFTGPRNGGRGQTSYVGFTLYSSTLAAAGAGGGGYNTYDRAGLPTGGASGLNQVGKPLTGSFANYFEGGYSGFFDDDAGGGAGSSQIGGDGLARESSPNPIGGAGGNGVNVSDWYWNSSLDVVGVIAGGGGGSATDSASPTAGLGSDGGGNGALGSNNGNDATTFGSGGGGCEEGDDSIYPKGGDGHDGLVVLRYQNKFKINDSGDDVFQVGDYWYHSFYASASFNPQYTFERPEKILVSI